MAATFKVLTVAGAFHNFVIRRFQKVADDMNDAGI